MNTSGEESVKSEDGLDMDERDSIRESQEGGRGRNEREENGDEDETAMADPRRAMNRVRQFNETAAGVQKKLTEADTFEILVATDIHVGYGEKKPGRSEDSINTFEEVLQIAVEEKVDFLLLAGDLFHENNPSRAIQHKVIQLLRKYCFNDNPVNFTCISDPHLSFQHSKFESANFEDMNLNVGLPVFTIHGNHDDMAGKKLTALDLLHEAGLVNLFGKFNEISQFDVYPVLMQKGQTRVALYGIGSQRDDRLCRAFKDNNVTFHCQPDDGEKWFNILTLHQNRPQRSTVRSTGSHIPAKLLPNFMELVVWGHEHESIPHAEWEPGSGEDGDGFYILQPGSTVATSLTVDEAKPKHVVKLRIRGSQFKLQPIELKTVRPMVVDTIRMSKVSRRLEYKKYPKPDEGIKQRIAGVKYLDEVLVEEKIREMLAKAKDLVLDDNRTPWPPLLRLNIQYDGEWANCQPLNAKKVGMQYSEEVANPVDMIAVKRERVKNRIKIDDDDMEITDPTAKVSALTVEQIIAKHFETVPMEEKLTILDNGTIADAMSIFADDVDSTAGLATIRSANAEFITKLKDKVGEVQKSLNKMQLPDLPDLTSGERAPRGDRIYKTLLDTVTADVAVYKEMAYQSHVIDLETETGNIPSVSSQSTQQSSSHSLALSRQSTQASDSHRLARMNELASQMAASQQQQSSRRAPLKEQNRPRKRAAARNQDEAMFDDDDDDF